MVVPRGAARARSGRVASASTTPSRPAALITNEGTTPKRPMSMPASAGPTMRALLNAAELSATALTRSALPTISAMNDWRAGPSKVWASPANTATTATCQ